MEKDNKMKNKRNFIIIGIIIVVIVGIICAIFVNKNKAINTGSNSNNNGIDNTQNNIFNSSKIIWVRNENLKTDSNYSEEENTVKTTNVNIDSLTNITLEEFINKWSNSDYNSNFITLYPIENEISYGEIKKDEMLWSTRDIYLKGVLPGFEMRFTIKHPDYLSEDFLGVNNYDINVKDFIITNIQFEGNMFYQNLRKEYEKDFNEYASSDYDILAEKYSSDDRAYIEDVYDKFYLVDPETTRTEEEITDTIINSIEEIMSWVYKDYKFTDEIKQDLTTILNCMYWNTQPYQDEGGRFSSDYNYNENYKTQILSIKWQNENIKNRHEIYVNKYPNCSKLIIR